MNLSPIARLLFIGLWNFCDDAGIHPASIKSLKAQIFPVDDIDVASLVDELIQEGLVDEYEVEGKSYWRVTGWQRHQRIDRPTFKHPLPNGVIPKNHDEVMRVLEFQAIKKNLDEYSPNERRALTPGMEGKGMEGKGRGR
ncbi:hypothetical protein AOG1_16200 [Geobacter sp. AOG1]|nr:hypothetical protein AOG1_16200 [Geobacter sp. AOG1]